MRKRYNVAIVGTGVVGATILEILDERNFPIKELKLLATERSAGKTLRFRGEDITIQETTSDAFTGIDFAIFASGSASKEYAGEVVKRGAVVIDNSSAFRLNPEVPLIVPEVNPEDISWHRGIVANPNCSTIQMVVALKPIYDAVGIKRVVVSTYQAVSGAGKEAMNELEEQTRTILQGEEVVPRVFPHQIAFNVIPHIDVFLEKDYTKEEMKMVNETKKIFHDDKIAITATTVRIPVLRSHAEAINIETEEKITPNQVREILSQAPGVSVVDDPANMKYPMPIDASNRDEVLVGRIREDISHPNGIWIWVVADQLRKGAATNSVQIAELLFKE